MGASDFAITEYSYDDVAKGEKDFKLEKFSIEHDRAYIIPLVKQALARNPNLKIIAIPVEPARLDEDFASMIFGALSPKRIPRSRITCEIHQGLRSRGHSGFTPSRCRTSR